MVELRHEVITSPEDLARLRPAWASASRGTGVPFLQPEWTVAAAAAWGSESELAVHVVRSGDEVVAVAPLRGVRTRAGTRLVILWDRTGEPTMMFHRDRPALEALVTGLVSGGRPLSLPGLRVDGPELDAFRTGVRGRAMSMLDAPRGVAYAPFETYWHEFETQLSPSARSWLRRKLKKLKTFGSVTVEAVRPGPAEVGANLERLMVVEAASWKGRAGTAISQDPWLSRFLRDYTTAAAELGTVRFYFLCVDGRAVAAHLYVVDGNRLWQLKIGYDDAYAACSPGILLMHEVLQKGHEEGLAGCEYLGSAEQWQTRWPVTVRDHSRLLLYPASRAGLAHVVRDAGRKVGRRVADRRQRTGV
jgi:CelD/BcsL family acetyltransferase involved in cellulose biosynthesis